MRGSLFVPVLALLAACSPAAQQTAATEAYAGGAEKAMAVMDAPAEASPAAPPGASPAAQAQSGSPLLAYSYSVSFEVSAKAVPPLLAQHQAACQAAGAPRCQIVNTSTRTYSEDHVEGHLEMRAEPRWLEGFRAGLAKDAKEAGGRVTASATESEDLTRSIVDTTATLDAQRALRNRLQNLLESRPGKLAELLEVERELARVQGELNGLSSNLAVMQARVSTSLLTLDYASRPSAVSGDAWAPLREAVTSFFGIVLAGFALLIRLFAALLPFVLVLGPLAWLGLRAWGRRRAAPPKAKKSRADVEIA